MQRAEEARDAIIATAGQARIRDPMFSIDWHFVTSCGELESATIEEMADDVLLDQAYPQLDGGVAALASSETILVLQGPPGTGKTRLIRAVLGEISRRQEREAQALYTGDKKALESDEIFVKFVTGWDDALVRPGRCFARVFVRELTPAEASALLGRLCAGPGEHVDRALALLAATERKSHSLAEIYRAHERAGPPQPR